MSEVLIMTICSLQLNGCTQALEQYQRENADLRRSIKNVEARYKNELIFAGALYTVYRMDIRIRVTRQITITANPNKTYIQFGMDF